MSRSVSLILLLCAVLLLTAAAETPLVIPAGQSVANENLQVQPVYWLTAQSNFSREPMSGPDLITFRLGIEKELGRPRCRVASKSQAEIEKDIESDAKVEALYIETKLTDKKPKVVLWAKCQDHEGKIAEYPCDPGARERCVGYALRDFPADISDHDAKCHRGKPCRRLDARYFIIPDVP